MVVRMMTCFKPDKPCSRLGAYSGGAAYLRGALNQDITAVVKERCGTLLKVLTCYLITSLKPRHGEHSLAIFLEGRVSQIIRVYTACNSYTLHEIVCLISWKFP